MKIDTVLHFAKNESLLRAVFFGLVSNINMMSKNCYSLTRVTKYARCVKVKFNTAFVYALCLYKIIIKRLIK